MLYFNHPKNETKGEVKCWIKISFLGEWLWRVLAREVLQKRLGFQKTQLIQRLMGMVALIQIR
nr:MAG TPA: hypothetical protein [Caudoviricetes sp.]